MRKLVFIIFVALVLFFMLLPMCSASTTVAMNSSSIVYSPYNWYVTSGSAQTINAGAYFRTIFSGTSLSITTSTGSNTSPYGEVWARVDGDTWTQFTLSGSNATFAVATGLANRQHYLEVVVKSTAWTIPRWASSQTIISLTGLVLDTGAQLYTPTRRTKNIVVFGDSITEAANTAYVAAGLPTDISDALSGWCYNLAQAVNAEVGCVGFAGTGIMATYDGVPSLPNSYNYILSGVSRSFSPAPDLIIYAEGHNDNAQTAANVSAYFQTVMTGMLSLAPSAKQVAIEPLSGYSATGIQMAVTAMNNPLITYQDTTGWLSVGDTEDGVHPWGYADMGYIAPRVAAAVTPLLYPTSTSTAAAPTAFAY